MSDHWLQEANDRGDEADTFCRWIESNEDFIIEQYAESDPEIPESVFEGVLDDDYPEAEESYLEGLKLEDVPDDYIESLYQTYCED